MNGIAPKARIRSLLAVLATGFEPAGPVMGVGTYQFVTPVSCQYYTAGMYVDALQAAWDDVILRLGDDAARLGAHGVVGVHVTESPGAAGPGTIQLQLTGTAVRVMGAEPLSRPFLSMLGLDDTLKLIGRGWVPSGLVVGLSAEHVHGWGTSPLLQGSAFSNTEMPGPTEGMQAARYHAENRARMGLRSAGAEGLVAPDVSITRTGMGCYQGNGMLIMGRILGTALVRFEEPVLPIDAVRRLA